MKILLITQWWDPEPATKGLSFAKELQSHGHTVQVLTGFPNYPTGKLYPGYKLKFYQKEKVDGIDIIRVPLYPSHDSSAIGRIANYLSFAMSAAVLGPWLTERPDVIYVYHPPPTTYITAFVLKLLYRVPVVYDIQDFWPDTLAATGMFNNKTGLKLIDAYCRLLYKAAAKIVVLSPGFKQKLIGKGVPAEKIEVIYNWFDDSKLTSGHPASHLPQVMTQQDVFKVLFAGNMGKAQALDTVLDAAKQLDQTRQEIQFIFIGGGVEVASLKKKTSEAGLSNVHFLNAVPFAEIVPILNAADVLLVHLKKDPLFEITIPSKIQAYLAAGKPVLMAVPGDATDIVTQAQAGLSCDSENPQMLAQKIVEFSNMPKERLIQLGENGRRFYDSNMSMQVGVDRFHELFEHMVSGKKQVSKPQK